MIDALSLYRTFLRCVETGSFSAVAKERGTSQPTVSRQIAALEDRLGCLLFQRTTRALTLTEDGEVFYRMAQEVVEAASEAESAVGRGRGRVAGRLRLVCGAAFGRLHVVPHLSALMGEYPELEVDLTMQDSFTDLIADGIDLAIRVGESDDSSLISRRIGASRRVLVATPEYLERAGSPQQVSDLAQHRCIVFSGLAAGDRWTFKGQGAPTILPVSGPFRVDNSEGVRAAVLAGLGIGYMPIWHFASGELDDGRLVELLPACAPPAHPINAVYPSRRHLPSKVRATMEFLAAIYRGEPLLQTAP